MPVYEETASIQAPPTRIYRPQRTRAAGKGEVASKMLSHKVAAQLRHSRYGIMAFLGLFFGTFLTLTSPIWLTLLFLNLPILTVLYVLYFYTKLFNPLIKLGWKLFFTVLGWFSTEEMALFNPGYSDSYSTDGLFIEGHPRNQFDRYRFQLYEHLIYDLGLIDNMEGKTLMEAGCGRGGGLRYIADRYRPRIAIGVDFNQNQVRLNPCVTLNRSTTPVAPMARGTPRRA